MTPAKLTWHWICAECADVARVARYYRIDGLRRPGRLCCFCLERVTLPCLEAQARKMTTCSC